MVGATARSYAKALFEVAAETAATPGRPDQAVWGPRLEALREIFGRPEVLRVVANPSVSPARRLQAAEALITPEMGRECANLARLLVARGRIEVLDGVIEEFNRLTDEANGRVLAVVTTAIDLDDAERDKVAANINRVLEQEARLVFQTDPSILGGLLIQVGDRLIDASVAGKLQQLRRALTTA